MSRIAPRFSGFIVVAVATSFSTHGAFSEELTSERFGFSGSNGIIDVPTAEVAPDGELAVSYHRFGPTRRTTLTFQATPRLSASFRYSGTDDLVEGYGMYWDRSFDVSYLLMTEGDLRPAVAVGMRDFMGTGFFGSEYIVATKSIGERLRVTGGLGWGRLGSYNELFSIGDREEGYRETGGTLNTGKWFQGPVAAFGGLTYQLTDKMTLLAEYSSDAYTQEVERGIMAHNSPFNIGLNYKLGENLNLSAAYLYGDTVGIGVSGHINPKTPPVNGGLESAPLPVKLRPSRSADELGWSGRWIDDGTDEPGIREALASAFAKEGLTLEAMSLTETRTEVRFRNTRYPAGAEALGRASRIMSRAFPPSVETFVLTEVVNGMPVQSTVISRRSLEQLEFEPAGEMLAATSFADPRAVPSDPMVRVDDAYPKLSWGLSPYLVASLFDPDSPVRADLGLRGEVSYEPLPGVVLDGVGLLRLTGNVADADVDDDDVNVLPAVRSNGALYSNRFQLERLTANWYHHPVENIYTRLSFGYLERAFGGVSGEVLWKRPESRFALGAEINYVKQRDYEELFSFQDYDVVTGHVSGYYDFGNGFHGQLDAGRYLAGDWGATVSLDREFNNGWSVGAYATLTDVPFEDFGEGSFDKGIRLSIPMSWFLGTPTKQVRDVTLQSLARDGGARLNVNGRLYDELRNSQQPELEDRWGRFWR